MEIPRIWRAKQYKGPEITRCLHCDDTSLGHRPICLNCGEEAKTLYIIKTPENNQSNLVVDLIIR